MTLGTVTVAGRLVRHLRTGVRRELSASLAMLLVEVDTHLDPDTYFRALHRFESARALFDAIGVSDRPDQPDVDLDLDLWPRLILKALESQHDLEVMRLQDAAAAGHTLPVRDVPALRSLVADIREKTGAPPRHRRSPAFLEKQRTTRRLKWRRKGDGRRA
jgi:hypothetical protein